MSANVEASPRPLLTSRPLSHARVVANLPRTQQATRQPTQDYPMTPLSDFRTFVPPGSGDLTSPTFNTAAAPMNNSFWINPAQRMSISAMPMYPATPDMEYIAAPVDENQVWESRQPGKKSKRGQTADLTKDEGLAKRREQNRDSQARLRLRRLNEMIAVSVLDNAQSSPSANEVRVIRLQMQAAVRDLGDQNHRLQEQLRHSMYQLNYWHSRELNKCNEKRAKMGSPLYESFDAMVRCDHETDRQIFVPYFQIQSNGLCLQGLETRRSSGEPSPTHSGSGASVEMQDADDDDDDGGNYSPTAHRGKPYRHSAFKGKSSGSFLLCPSDDDHNTGASSAKSSANRPTSSGSSSNAAASRGKKTSKRGQVSSPTALTTVVEEPTYNMGQGENDLYRQYSQITVSSEASDSYFAADAPTSCGYP
ncbi:hypothetical protein QFC22_001263 [Naganishia vaughanmartiniae]|uniref:Uncharacterized protein n=1 Tax=Naganishia vaughanmartiniae TaxID=1424756 RepID=A0ACC2XI61_9TREE|nr:hypothetical protein QFC22_001263 [Naganishia vaughanmartiniae]